MNFIVCHIFRESNQYVDEFTNIGTFIDHIAV